MINKEYERFIGRLDRQKFEEDYPRCVCSKCVSKKRREWREDLNAKRKS